MDERVVVVVHGVGDPQPGDALTGFVNAYCIVTDSTVDGPLVTERREDKTHKDAAGQGLIPLFPVSRLTATVASASGARRTRFFEVYWGDLSRVKGSLLGLVEGTVDLVFGLRHVVFAAQRELAAAAERTRQSNSPKLAIVASTAALWMARGPVLALNILGAIASLLYVATGLLPKKTLSRIDASLTAVSVGALLTVVLGAVTYFAAKKSKWSTTTAESITVVGAAALIATTVAPDRYREYLQFAQDLTAGLSLFAGLLALSVVTLLFASLVTAIAFDDRVRYDEALRRGGRRALVVIDTCTILSCALFVFLVMLAWAVVANQLEGAGTTDLRGRITEGLHLFGLVWLSFIGIGVVYGGLMLRSRWLKRKPRVAGTRFPRYIVHPCVVALLIGSGIAWSSLFLPLVFQLECKHFIHDSDPRCTLLAASCAYQSTVEAMEQLNPLGVVLSGALVSTLLAGRAHLGTALDIVLDVISHFKRMERSARQVLQRPPRRITTNTRIGELGWTELFEPEPSEWNSMVARFRDVVESAVRTTQCKDLTVIAHSQGTMIALEALGVITIDRTDRPSTARRVTLHQNAACKIRLVTMGCPLADLYMHYFPAKYAINPRDKSLVTSWRNIHRADDFVGTSVPNPFDASFPENVEVGPRGHIDYWLDREVLEALKPILA
jgi:hypothetical protein